LFCTGLFAFCARQPNRWMALATATPFLVVVAVMSANRQGMAIGVVLLVMSRWSTLSVGRRSLGIVIAALFHASAGFLLILSVLDLRIGKIKKFFLILIVAAASIWLVSRSEAAWGRYTDLYVRQHGGVHSPGAIYHLLLNLIPALLMLTFRKHWSRIVRNWPLVHQLCWMSLALLVVLPFFTVAIGRMSLYLFPVSISFFNCLPPIIASGQGRAIVRTFSVMILAGILFIWLSFANTAHTYLPYQNVLTVEDNELVLPR
jgi:hypothetical protein